MNTGGKVVVETKGTFHQSKRQHADNDNIPYVPKHFAKHELSFQGHQALEPLDARIGHAKLAFVVASHCVNAGGVL